MEQFVKRAEWCSEGISSFFNRITAGSGPEEYSCRGGARGLLSTRRAGRRASSKSVRDREDFSFNLGGGVRVALM